jgi:hypothetical protein
MKVEYGENHHCFVGHVEVHSIWKVLQQRAWNCKRYGRELQGCGVDPLEHMIDGIDKPQPETGLSRLVPRRRIVNIRLGERPDNQTTRHRDR